MDSRSRFFILFSLSLILLASTVYGRKDPGEYWEEIMKGQPMPNAIKGLTSPIQYEHKDNKGVYNDDGSIKEDSFVKNFDPRPNISIYHDDVNPNKVKSIHGDCKTHEDGPMSKKHFMDDFEPRPNVSIYND